MTATTSNVGALALASMLAVASMVVVACSMGGDPGGVPIAEDARFMVTEPSGEARQVEDLDALLTLVPFEVVLPASVPEGVVLRSAQLTLPDPRFESLAPYARARSTPVLLSFSGGPASGFAAPKRRPPAATRQRWATRASSPSTFRARRARYSSSCRWRVDEPSRARSWCGSRAPSISS